MNHDISDLQKHANAQRQADELCYNSLISKGYSHEEAIQSIYESKAVLEYEQKKLQAEEAKTKHYSPNTTSEVSEEFDLKSYYIENALKRFIRLLIFGGAVYFILQDDAISKPITLETFLAACGLVSLIALILGILLLCIKLFNNLIIGGIAGILALGVLLDQADKLTKQYNITDEMLENAFIFIGVFYLITNFIRFVYNIVNAIKS